MQNNFMDIEMLEDRLRYWQAQLRLQDWQIEMKFDRGFNLAPNVADISLLEESRVARIRMMEANDFDPSSIAPYDMEQTMVHELLHIHFFPLTRTLGKSIPEEQAIEAISWALIALDRKADEIENHYMKRLYPEACYLLEPYKGVVVNESAADD
ncbi:hypothetical protein [Paenibacillus agilis]|uniref:Uncharacterized protein n=1 Tax=Paenibacillus agilis TaxID=3020863 RepID=A0A559IXA4_9BACL|nr:hypothetical protein [Paenibacillus agilis]TVX92268.1 hypothetical protein FPZ44_03835 [Paenibacillus agilis]